MTTQRSENMEEYSQEIRQKWNQIKNDIAKGEALIIPRNRNDQEIQELHQKWKNAMELNKKAQEHIKKLTWEKAVMEKSRNEANRRVVTLEKQLKNSEDARKMLEMELDQHAAIDKGLHTLKEKFTLQAEALSETKQELRKANDRAKQVEGVVSRNRNNDADCSECQSKVAKIKELRLELQKRDDNVAQMKTQLEKSRSNANENNKCDCRYKVMEAQAEVDTHAAAGEKLKEDREKYKTMYEQYAKERKSVMDRLKNAESKLTEKNETIEALKRGRRNVNRNGGDCRVVGAMKNVVEELSEEVRMKDRDIEQLRNLVDKLDAQLKETEDVANSSKNENQALANELIKRLREIEGNIVEREKLLQENAKLKMDMVAMVPEPSKEVKKSSIAAEVKRLTEKLQQTEMRLKDCKEENRKMRGKNDRKISNVNRNNNNENEGKIAHRNCVTCRIMDKLKMGLAGSELGGTPTPCPKRQRKEAETEDETENENDRVSEVTIAESEEESAPEKGRDCGCKKR